MSQHSMTTPVVGTVSGVALSENINAIAAALASNNSGPEEPTATFPHMWWADTTAGVLKRRNAADSGWISVMSLTLAISPFAETMLNDADAATLRATLSVTSKEDSCWYGKIIGEPFPLRDDLAGVAIPPTSSSDYRYIKFTASDAYNAGVLTSESVSGSAPDVIATAVISLVGSPLNGVTVNLLNTEGRFIRAGNSGTLETDMLEAHVHGQTVANGNPAFSQAGGGTQPSIANNNAGNGVGGLDTSFAGGIETRPKNQGATYYMRIK